MTPPFSAESNVPMLIASSQAATSPGRQVIASVI
jgi:hypothetical protein